jgi:hypothetical protein
LAHQAVGAKRGRSLVHKANNIQGAGPDGALFAASSAGRIAACACHMVMRASCGVSCVALHAHTRYTYVGGHKLGHMLYWRAPQKAIRIRAETQGGVKAATGRSTHSPRQKRGDSHGPAKGRARRCWPQCPSTLACVAWCSRALANMPLAACTTDPGRCWAARALAPDRTLEH